MGLQPRRPVEEFTLRLSARVEFHDEVRFHLHWVRHLVERRDADEGDLGVAVRCDVIGDLTLGEILRFEHQRHFLGLGAQRDLVADEAAALTVNKLQDSGRRFPAFWGPGHDWVPDHNWGGSGMIGLQEMLMQTVGDSIYLFPAWPRDWDVKFKLHAPFNTTIEGELQQGKVIHVKVTPESRRKDLVISEFVR